MYKGVCMSATDKYMDQAAYYWDMFVVEVTALGEDLYDWVTTLSNEERVIGICLFIIVLIYMIFSRRVRKNTDTGSGRQFGGALVLVLIFACGAGWNMDVETSAGAFSHIFQR